MGAYAVYVSSVCDNVVKIPIVYGSFKPRFVVFLGVLVFCGNSVVEGINSVVCVCNSVRVKIVGFYSEIFLGGDFDHM